jgi:hypothetical protein
MSEPKIDKQQKKWKDRLTALVADPEPPIMAITFRKGWRTKAQPVLLRCNDGKNYVVKGQQAGRQIINDQIVARLGMAIGAPVGEPKIVEIPTELVAIETHLSDISPGKAHGTLFISDCFDSWDLIATSEPENRKRLALLTTLYGWISANDRQFIFNNNPPRLIHSVDHGHFFPGGPNWTENDLMQAPSAELDPELSSICSLKPDEVKQALFALKAVREETIIQAVASLPSEWGLKIDERVTMVAYLIRRQQDLLALL